MDTKTPFVLMKESLKYSLMMTKEIISGCLIEGWKVKSFMRWKITTKNGRLKSNVSSAHRNHKISEFYFKRLEWLMETNKKEFIEECTEKGIWLHKLNLLK